MILGVVNIVVTVITVIIVIIVIIVITVIITHLKYGSSRLMWVSVWTVPTTYAARPLLELWRELDEVELDVTVA